VWILHWMPAQAQQDYVPEQEEQWRHDKNDETEDEYFEHHQIHDTEDAECEPP